MDKYTSLFSKNVELLRRALLESDLLGEDFFNFYYDPYNAEVVYVRDEGPVSRLEYARGYCGVVQDESNVFPNNFMFRVELDENFEHSDEVRRVIERCFETVLFSSISS